MCTRYLQKKRATQLASAALLVIYLLYSELGLDTLNSWITSPGS